MNIGFHCWEFPPTIVGGLGTYAQCVTEALAARGHDLTVWTPEQTGWQESVPPVSSDRITVHRLPLMDATPAFPHVFTDELLSWGSFFSDIFTFNTQAAIDTRRLAGLDLVAIQDWLSGLAGLMLARDRRQPLVFHVHSAEWGRQPGGGSPAVHHFEGAMGHEADAVITVSEAMREDLIAHSWRASRVHAIWNGVDPDRYRPGVAGHAAVAALRHRYGIQPGQPVVLFVGRMTSVKGVTELVEAFPSVLQSHPNARLIILGKGELEGPIADRVRALGIHPSVTLRYEFVTEAERIAHYELCDLAVFPSTYEPFGIVSLEAMALAKPAVVGARGVVGFREQVVVSGPNQTGMHVDGSSPADIAWALSEALRDPARLRVWGANGRQRVLDEFSWTRAAEKTEDVYQEVVNRFRVEHH